MNMKKPCFYYFPEKVNTYGHFLHEQRISSHNSVMQGVCFFKAGLRVKELQEVEERAEPIMTRVSR